MNTFFFLIQKLSALSEFPRIYVHTTYMFPLIQMHITEAWIAAATRFLSRL